MWVALLLHRQKGRRDMLKKARGPDALHRKILRKSEMVIPERISDAPSDSRMKFRSVYSTERVLLKHRSN